MALFDDEATSTTSSTGARAGASAPRASGRRSSPARARSDTRPEPTPELIARFRGGDPEAIRELYRSHNGAVFAMALSITGSRELAEEVVQQTFVKAWQAADRFQADRSITPWLYAIARRTAIDIVRHERRPTIGGHDVEVDHGVPGPSFERTWIVHEVRLAIDSLPACEREIVRLSHLAGVPHAEIARRCGLPIGTVKSRSVRARRRLAERLGHLRDHPENRGEPIGDRAP